MFECPDAPPPHPAGACSGDQTEPTLPVGPVTSNMPLSISPHQSAVFGSSRHYFGSAATGMLWP